MGFKLHNLFFGRDVRYMRGFLIDVERSLLYAWVLSFIIGSWRDLYATCEGFLICVETSLLYALVLTQQIISRADLNRSSQQLIQTDSLEDNLNS